MEDFIVLSIIILKHMNVTGLPYILVKPLALNPNFIICEGGIITFLSTVLFRDINENHIGLKEENYHHYVNLINDMAS